MDDYEKSVKRHCGRVGAIEVFLSGPGLESWYEFKTKFKKSSREVVDLYRSGDEEAKENKQAKENSLKHGAEGEQKGAKSSQKGSKRGQNGAEMGTQSDQNTSKHQSSEKVGSMIYFGCPQVEFLGAIFGLKSSNIAVFENIRVL